MKKLMTVLSVLLVFGLGFSQVNVVQNPSFEDWTSGMPNEWTKDASLTVEQEGTTVHSGSYSVKATTSTNKSDIEQGNLPVVPGANYQASIWTLDNDPDGSVKVSILFYDSNGSYVNTGSTYGDASVDSPNWQQVSSISIDAPANAASAKIRIRLYVSGETTVYYDDAYVPGQSSNAPFIANLTYQPFPANQPIDITCTVTVSSGTVDSVKFYHYTDLNPATLDSTLMTAMGNDQYSISLPGLTNASSLIYWVKAWGNGAASFTAEKKVLIGVPDIGMFHTQLDADGLPLHKDHLAKLRGIVTAASGIFSTTRYDFYMQDNTGGINIFSFTMGTEQYNEGDSLEVEGIIDTYNGKVEITEFTATVLSSGNPVPTPIDVNIEDMGEEFEGRLISIDNVTLAASSAPWYSTPPDTSFNVTITDGTGELTLRVVGSTDIGGNPEPTWPITVIGIGSQYDYSAPYFEGYQILPRYYSDLQATAIDDNPQVAYRYELEQNYPNPFNPQTTIRYQLKEAGKVSFRVFNLLGQEVYHFNAEQTAGTHKIVFDGSQLASGVYFYKLEAGDFSAVRKMILMK